MKVVEDVPVLFPERTRDGHDALRKAFSAIALGAKGPLAPEDEGTEISLGEVVSGLDTVVIGAIPGALIGACIGALFLPGDHARILCA